MGKLYKKPSAIEWQDKHQKLRIEPWGEDSLRVRATLWGEIAEDRIGALLPVEPASNVEITEAGGICKITNGTLSAQLEVSTGNLTFLRHNVEILRERSTYLDSKPMPARRLNHGEGELIDIAIDFASDSSERFMGLGQNPNGALNQKGNRVEFRQRNGHVTVPFLVSNRGYGLFWNNAGLGEVSLDNNQTLWRAKGSHQLDYWITAGDTHADIVRNYTKATGLPPKMPEWATGFWQSRLRYSTREDLETVAETHVNKGLPLSVIVIDYFAWSKQGEWKFNDEDWPDPSSMVQGLAEKGIKTMVSIWPSVNPKAQNYPEMLDKGFLIRSREGLPLFNTFLERDETGPTQITFYDASNPEARDYVWSRCRDGYYQHGIKTWWLDACEPEFVPDLQQNAIYAAGAGSAVTNAYPFFNAQTFYNGMKSEGEDEIVLLCRSAWAGSQRFGSLVWSGDVQSDFEALAGQIRVALNMSASGISWWTSDIGGFSNGDPEDPEFRELIVRWFQFGVFCPVCRLHGNRLPGDSRMGGPNEIWSFGPEVEALLAEQLQHREKLRPYVLAQMDQYAIDGTPVMRALGTDFPDDPQALDIEDTYMFGEAYLIAPVTKYKKRCRQVYLPAGQEWTCYWTGAAFEGGQWIDANAPLNQMPVFERNMPEV